MKRDYDGENTIHDHEPSSYRNYGAANVEASNEYMRYNQSPKESTSSLLMNGTYDEREAHESFKQAVLEWRNSNTSKQAPNSNRSPTKQAHKTTKSKDAFVDTSTESQLTTRSRNALRDLEEDINTNHTLSYAERMLLQKYRRNDFEYQSSVDESDTVNQSRDDSAKVSNKKQSASNRNSIESIRLGSSRVLSSGNKKSIEINMNNSDANMVRRNDQRNSKRTPASTATSMASISIEVCPVQRLYVYSRNFKTLFSRKSRMLKINPKK